MCVKQTSVILINLLIARDAKSASEFASFRGKAQLLFIVHLENYFLISEITNRDADAWSHKGFSMLSKTRTNIVECQVNLFMFFFCLWKCQSIKIHQRRTSLSLIISKTSKGIKKAQRSTSISRVWLISLRIAFTLHFDRLCFSSSSYRQCTYIITLANGLKAALFRHCDFVLAEEIKRFLYFIGSAFYWKFLDCFVVLRENELNGCAVELINYKISFERKVSQSIKSTINMVCFVLMKSMKKKRAI